MGEKELEKVMLQFVGKEVNLLVCTSIIESGLDIPAANTILINHAERFGLADLYQIRGRVGRGSHQAYAYLIIPGELTLSGDAMRRLRAIQELSELGSGFKLAIQDLEIRGAGNLLGMAQSGNMDALGYDLYVKLVQESVREIKSEQAGDKVKEPGRIECQVDIELDAYLPEYYVEDESLRINLYRRLAAYQELSQVEQFEKELTDRFGPLPVEASRLLEAARLRMMGEKLGLKKLILEARQVKMIFDDQWVDRFQTQEHFSERLRSIVKSAGVPVQFIQKGGFGLKAQISETDILTAAKNVLQSLA